MADRVGSRCVAIRSPSLSKISDMLKGSFYANPLIEDISVSDEVRLQFPEYYGKNICVSVSGLRHITLLTNIVRA